MLDPSTSARNEGKSKHTNAESGAGGWGWGTQMHETARDAGNRAGDPNPAPVPWSVVSRNGDMCRKRERANSLVPDLLFHSVCCNTSRPRVDCSIDCARRGEERMLLGEEYTRVNLYREALSPRLDYAVAGAGQTLTRKHNALCDAALCLTGTSS